MKHNEKNETGLPEQLAKRDFYTKNKMPKKDLDWLLNQGLSENEIEFFLDEGFDDREYLFYLATKYGQERWEFVQNWLNMEGLEIGEDYFIEDFYNVLDHLEPNYLDSDVIYLLHKYKSK